MVLGFPLLVSAAAGSGKTKVLVDRLMSYLCDPVRPANIDDFLMITYTKAAASELRGKIAAKLTEFVANEPNNTHMRRQLQRLYLTQISTVHSFCTDVLRQYAYRLNIPGDFRVADENECNDIRTRVLQKLLDEGHVLLRGKPVKKNLKTAVGDDFRQFGGGAFAARVNHQTGGRPVKAMDGIEFIGMRHTALPEFLGDSGRAFALGEHPAGFIDDDEVAAEVEDIDHFVKNTPDE